MATVKELQAEVAALRAEVAALRAEVAALRAELVARPGWIQVVPAPAQPVQPYPIYPTITCGTSTDNPALATVTLINKGA